MPSNRSKKPSFIIVTKDFCGLGFGKMIQDAGYPVVMAYAGGSDELEVPDAMKAIGTGLIQRVPLKQIFAARNKYKDSYWIFDSNHYPEMGERLFEEGFRVWGGRQLQYDMEHDRDFGVELVKSAGIDSPETLEFSTREEGIKFLEANPDRAFVFKPNEQDSSWDTFLPDSEKDHIANIELLTYLQAVGDGNGKGYILQERKRGVEANFEVWCHNGTPYFGFCDLESKKKLNDDSGCLVGGAQDIAFQIPVDSYAIQSTVGKLLETDALKNYTGFLDINVIVADRQNYFLEFCARFGYPAHPTLFSTLALDPFPELIMDMIDGNIENFGERFRFGFGAGISLYTDKQKTGMPIYIAEDKEKQFYQYDLYKKKDILLTAGLAPEVGVITGHGYTIKDAAEEAILNMKKVNFPNRSGRTDLDRNCYPSAPQGRYDALVAMKYF